MALNTPHVIDGSVAGAWLKRGLTKGFGPLVEQHLPADFAAYLRICHPARDHTLRRVTWTEVAQRLCRVAHAEMQWHSLIGSAPHERTNEVWPTGAPAVGELDPNSLETLLQICGTYTPRSNRCFFGVSTINDDIRTLSRLRPNLQLLHREFIVLEGPLGVTPDLATTAPLDSILVVPPVGEISQEPLSPEEGLGLVPLSPNLIWPSDHSWCCVTEFDFDSTLIGGSEDLIDALLAEPRLETWTIALSASLAEDADKFNL